MFCAARVVFGGNEGVGYRFHDLRSRTKFRPYRVCRVPFLCFARQDSFSTVPRATRLVFMICTPGLLLGGNEGVGSRFDVSRSRSSFRRYRRASGPVFMFRGPGLDFGGSEGVGSLFHVSRSRICFRRYRWGRVSFSCFACPDSFTAVPRASAHVFKFCVPRLIFGGIEGDGSRFHVLRARSRLRWYRGPRVPF
jgi:hypothetical protein